MVQKLIILKKAGHSYRHLKTKRITTLKTVYPYGLNEKINRTIKSINKEIIVLNFLSLKRMHGRMRGTKYMSSSNLKGRKFVIKLNKY